MRHCKGYMVIVKTTINENNRRRTTETILDNKAWKRFGSVCNRIHSIVKNKCDKHNYRVLYDNLTTNRKDRMHSDIKLVIMRNNYDVVKDYIVRPMQIEI